MNNSGIFITGCPRSGTTLLQSILASHSQIYSAPETSYFSRIIPRLGVSFSRPDAKVGNREIGMIRKDFYLMTGIELRRDFDGGRNDLDMRTVFELMMESFNKDHKSMWVEKTTLHARNLPLIKTFYPNMRVVNVIRDPVACVGSMAQIRPTGFSDLRIHYLASLADFCGIWNDCVSMAMNFPGKNQVLHIRYEDLVENTASTVEDICQFLDIEYEPHMLESFHESAKNILSGDACPWQKKNLRSGVARDSLYAWRDRLGPAKSWLIQRYTLRHAMELGYYEEDLKSNRITLLLTYVRDQFLRVITASRIELIFRKLFTGKIL